MREAFPIRLIKIKITAIMVHNPAAGVSKINTPKSSPFLADTKIRKNPHRMVYAFIIRLIMQNEEQDEARKDKE